MQLLLVRHGQPVTQTRDDGGFADPHLSDIGRQQADLVAQWLIDWQTQDVPLKIYSSPMARAFQTAEPIAAAVGTGIGASAGAGVGTGVGTAAAQIAVRPGLSEFDKNSSSYVPMEVLKHTDRERWNLLASGTFDAQNKDTVEGWLDEVVSTIEQIVADHSGEMVAVACHGGVINAYLAHCLGFSAEKFLRFDVDYTSVTRVMASGQGHRSVLSINERTHLRGYPHLTLGN